jgi:raffinose/stachyose/melibiose transport system permease protein
MAKKPTNGGIREKVLCLVLDVEPSDLRKPGYRRKAFGLTALVGLLFVLPAFLSNIVFDWIPMLDGIYKSFFQWSRYTDPVFVGMENFRLILVDPMFYASLKNMLFFLVANLVLMLPTIIVCVVMFRIRSSKTQYVYRILLSLQMVIPGLVFTLMWIFLLGYDFGAINHLLQNLGFDRIMFLGDASLIKWTVLLTGIPFVSANTAMIYIGGLNGIGESVWEAAQIEGVGPIRRFTALEFPLIIGQFKLNLIGVLGASITAYGQQLIFYNGSVHQGIMTPGLLMYFKAFPNTGAPEYGYAYALGLLLFVVALAISLLTMKFVKSAE